MKILASLIGWLAVFSIVGLFPDAAHGQNPAPRSAAEPVPRLSPSVPRSAAPPGTETRPKTTRIVIEGARFTGSSVAVGATASLRVTVRNAGTGESSRFDILVRRRSRTVARVRVSSLPAGRRTERTLEFPLSGSPERRCYQVALQQPSGGKLDLGGARQACLTVAAAAATIQPLEKTQRQAAVPRTPQKQSMNALEEGLLLTVNGGSQAVTVNEGTPATVQWQIGTVSPASGIKLFLTADPNTDYCVQGATSSDPNWGYRGGYPNGTYTLVHNPYYLERTVYVYGCVWNEGGSPEYAGVALNTVEMRYLSSPDLTVSDLFIASDEVRFKVKNIDDIAVKKPGRVNYQLTVTAPSTVPKTFEGLAALTTLARLNPQEETGEDRVTGHNVPLLSNTRLSLCINPDRKIPEANYENNCLTRVPGQFLPDLAVSGGRMNLFKPPEDDGLLDFLADCVTNFGCEFDTSGHTGDYIDVVVRNTGNLPMTNFDVLVGYWSEGGSGSQTLKQKVSSRVEPGRSTKVTFYLGSSSSRWGDAGCCGVTAMVDPDQKITEFDEGNNKKSLATVRLTAVRDHRSR
ncbi:MAG TPA: CARDB domain-containing protein [Candidatus Binatia bacterium]